MKRALAGLACWVVGCGGTEPAPITPRPEPAPTATMAAAPTEPRGAPVREVAATAPSASKIADSPLTPLAYELLSLAKAALRGEPLPAVSFPVERVRSPDRLVGGDAKNLPAELEYIAFAMELEIALGPPDSGTSHGPGGSDPKGLELQLLLTRHGLKVMELDVSEIGGAVPAPPWLPVEGLARELLADLKNERIDRWLVGDDELALLGPRIAKEVQKDRPKPKDLREAKQLVDKGARAYGFVVDDVTWVARDAHGELWGLRMQFEDGAKELDAHPLVSVRRAED